MYKRIKALMRCLDPLHVGCGSFMIERVDKPVFREVGTNLPVIPGSGISGVLRAALTRKINRNEKNPQNHCNPGTGQGEDQKHCGSKDCPACLLFGNADDINSKFNKGCCSFHDAHLVLFPAYERRQGPVWLTTENLFKEIQSTFQVKDAGVKTEENREVNLLIAWQSVKGREIHADNANGMINRINLGRSIYAVSEKDFSLLVNDGLEVRMSVSIDPFTGAAAERKLFNFEAVPRESCFLFEMTLESPAAAGGELIQDDLLKKLECALDDLSALGVGGMNTRGFGRMEKIYFNS